MSVVFTKNKGGNGRERQGWLLSQEELLENQRWAPGCLPQALSSWPGWWKVMPWQCQALGISGSPSLVRVWHRRKPQELHCEHFALRQEMFNTWSSWELPAQRGCSCQCRGVWGCQSLPRCSPAGSDPEGGRELLQDQQHFGVGSLWVPQPACCPTNAHTWGNATEIQDSFPMEYEPIHP